MSVLIYSWLKFGSQLRRQQHIAVSMPFSTDRLASDRARFAFFTTGGVVDVFLCRVVEG
jgi:hypothetical protein